MNALVPVPLLNAARFAEAITFAWQTSIQGFIAAGQILTEAKTALQHGEFTHMVDEMLPFGKRVAQTLMRIAADKRLHARSIAALLPADYTTLYELTRLTDDTFQARLADGTIRPDMRRGEAVKGRMDASREVRLTTMRELAANPMQLPSGPFGCGIADPPWEDPDSPIGYSGRHYRQHYETMTPTQIAAMPVAAILARNAIFALWITRHHLAIGSHLPVLRAWNLTPNTVLTWDKVWIGLGNGFVRDRTEHIVLATRGDVPAPPPELRPDSLYAERRTAVHSAKPPERLHIWMEGWCPDDPLLPMSRVELFARRRRPGWAAWGNQAGAPMVAMDAAPIIIEHQPDPAPAPLLSHALWMHAMRDLIASGDDHIRRVSGAARA